MDDKKARGKKTQWSGGLNVGFFKINSQVEKGIHKGRVDPFKVMEKEFITLTNKDIDETDEELLKEMVRNNVLYFDPTRAEYYPQGKSYQWGIRSYFESIRKTGNHPGKDE